MCFVLILWHPMIIYLDEAKICYTFADLKRR